MSGSIYLNQHSGSFKMYVCYVLCDGQKKIPCVTPTKYMSLGMAGNSSGLPTAKLEDGDCDIGDTNEEDTKSPGPEDNDDEEDDTIKPSDGKRRKLFFNCSNTDEPTLADVAPAEENLPEDEELDAEEVQINYKVVQGAGIKFDESEGNKNSVSPKGFRVEGFECRIHLKYWFVINRR